MYRFRSVKFSKRVLAPSEPPRCWQRVRRDRHSTVVVLSMLWLVLISAQPAFAQSGADHLSLWESPQPPEIQKDGKASGVSIRRPLPRGRVFSLNYVALKLFRHEWDIAPNQLRDADRSSQAVDLIEAAAGDDESQPKRRYGSGSGGAAGKGFRRALGDNVNAVLSYDHVLLSAKQDGRTLRSRDGGGFSSARDRDVIGVLMDWHVGKTRLGVGYRLESSRRAEHDSGGEILDSEEISHGMNLGVSRSWGGDD